MKVSNEERKKLRKTLDYHILNAYEEFITKVNLTREEDILLLEILNRMNDNLDEERLY